MDDRAADVFLPREDDDAVTNDDRLIADSYSPMRSFDLRRLG